MSETIRICGNPNCNNQVPPRNKKYCSIDCWNAIQPKIDQWQGIELIESGLRKRQAIERREFETRRRKYELHGADFGVNRIAKALCQSAFVKVNKTDTTKHFKVESLFKMRLGNSSHDAIEEALVYELADELPIAEDKGHREIEYKDNEFFKIGYYIDIKTIRRIIEIKTNWSPKAFIKIEPDTFLDHSAFQVYQGYAYMYLEGLKELTMYVFYYLAQALLIYDYDYYELKKYFDNTPYGEPILRCKELYRRIKKKDFSPDPIIDFFGYNYFCTDCPNWYCSKYEKGKPKREKKND